MGPSIVASGPPIGSMIRWLMDPANAAIAYPFFAVVGIAAAYQIVTSLWSRRSRAGLTEFGARHGLDVVDGTKAQGPWNGVEVVVEVLDGREGSDRLRPLYSQFGNPVMMPLLPFLLMFGSASRAVTMWRRGGRLKPTIVARAKALGGGVSCLPRAQRVVFERAGVPTGDADFDAVVHVQGPVDSVCAALGADQRRKVRAMLEQGHRLEVNQVVVTAVAEDVDALAATLSLAVSLAQDLGRPELGVLALVARAQGDDLPAVRARALDALHDLYGRAHTTQAAVAGVLRRASIAPDDADALAAALRTDPVVARAAAYRLADIGRPVHVPALHAVEGTDGPMLDELVEHAILSIQARVGPEALGRLTAVEVSDAHGGLSVVAPDARGALSVEPTKR